MKDDLHQIQTQLIRIHQQGHYVYHHIHPHWLDATYLESEKQWDLSNQSQFSVEALTADQALTLINRSTEILEEWLKPIDSSYMAEGYRAGGLFIQPFEKFIIPFEKNNIVYDFSVLRGAKCALSNASYDFTNVPKTNHYQFDVSVLKESSTGKFTEIAIELVQNKGIYKIMNSLWFRLFYKNDAFADGKSNTVVIQRSRKQSFLSKFSNSETLSFELANPMKNWLYLKHIGNNEFTHFISHPKLVGPNSLKSMDKLLDKIDQRYTIQSDFKTILQVKG